MKNRVEPFSPYTPGITRKSEYQPDVMGAMCDAAFLAFQLPEAPEVLERDLDEVSCSWLRLRRATHYLGYEPMVATTKVTPRMWNPECMPPSRHDIQLLEEFYGFVSKRCASLEDYFDAVDGGTGMFTLFSLRNVLGLLGSKDDVTVTNGNVAWPKELSSAENIWAAIGRLLRSNGSDITKERFVQLKAWIDAENFVSAFLDSHGVEVPRELETAGSKLRKIVRMVENCHKVKVDAGTVLECVQMYLEMEPKVTTQYLLLEGKITAIMDMVIAQGLTCVEDKTSIILWHVCTRLVHKAMDLRCPTVAKPSLSKSGSGTQVSPLGQTVPAALRLAGSTSEPNLSAKPSSSPRGNRSIVLPTLSKPPPLLLHGGSRTNSRATSPQTPPLPAILSPGGTMKEKDPAATPSTRPHSESSEESGTDGAEMKDRASTPTRSKDAIYLRRCSNDVFAGERVITPDKLKPKAVVTPERTGTPPASSARSTSSAQTGKASGDETVKTKPTKIIKRNTSLSFKATKSLPEFDHKPRTMSSTPSLGRSNSPAKPVEKSIVRRRISSGQINEEEKRAISPKEPIGLNSLQKAARKMTLVRRKSICGSSDLHALKADSERAEPSDKAWEIRVCALLWESMPPQCLTYAIGAGLHALNSRRLRGRLIRSAWALLDEARAIDYSIGNIGIKRLRLEMDHLLDSFSRSINFGKDPDPDELAKLLHSGRLNMAHLESIVQSSGVFAQVAVMYGIPFIAECMCGWAENVAGSTMFVLSCRDLLRVLNPYLVQFFQRREPDVDERWIACFQGG